MNKVIILLLIAFGCTSLSAQEKEVLSLKETIQRAKEQSPSYYRAVNQAENEYWNYRQFRASNMPQLRLNGTLPEYSKSISRVIQDDGTYAFRPSEQLLLDASLAINQRILLTGGSFSVSSSLQRTDVYDPVRRLDYFSVPVSLSYSQPMMLYNELKWNNRIQPIVYKESQRAFHEDMETISGEATELYFNALDASINKQIATLNVSNNDTLYQISKGRYNLGKIAENDLLQIELNLLNARNSLRSADLNYEIATQNLKRYLGIPTNTDLDLSIPTDVPEINIPIEKALDEARNNRQAVLEFRRRRLEAEQAVAAAKGQSGYNFNLQANFGLNKQDSDFNEVYASPFSQQNRISVGISIPIIDWGNARAQVRRAEANRELVEVNVQQDEINFEQEVYLQVMRFNMQNEQLEIAAKADTVAQKRYEVTKQRYLTGKITITDLNLAQSEKDSARKNYLGALRSYWSSYYTVRKLTLYDFVNQGPISYEN
ncbi:MAG: TolC family protein [Owenweeksia sp.]